ncbi:MAG: hypothetical protein ABIC68_02020 [Candidatus Omnitrophota bacterium]
MIFHPVLEMLSGRRIKMSVLAVVVFGAYVIFVVRPVCILYCDTDASFSNLLQSLALAKRSLSVTQQGGAFLEYADKTETSEVLSSLSALLAEEQMEVEDIRLKNARKTPLKNGSVFELRVRGREGALLHFLARLKDLSFLCRIGSVHMKAVAGGRDELEARLQLEKIDFIF